MSEWGDRVCELFASAEEEVAVVAPFIKTMAIRKLLKSCGESVSVRVLGRFLPKDIVAGVCDIEAAELLLDYPRSSLYTHPLLHAKLYRADSACLVGSANVTLRGLGWLPLSNEELLVSSERVRFVKEFEERLILDGEEMTWPRLRDLQARIRSLPKPASAEPPAQELHQSGVWLPTCRTPGYLFDVYAGTSEWRLLKSARKAAERDLQALEPLPSDLDRPDFEAAVRTALRRHPVVVWLVKEQGAVAGDVVVDQIEPLRRQMEVRLSADLLWEVFQEWLLYFLPTEFRLVATETKLSHGRRI